MTTDDGAAVRAWTSATFANDDGVLQLAKAFTSFGWTQVMSDVVARRVTRINPEGMARLMDLDAFRQRVEAVAAAGGGPEVQDFLKAWQRSDQGKSD